MADHSFHFYWVRKVLGDCWQCFHCACSDTGIHQMPVSNK